MKRNPRKNPRKVKPAGKKNNRLLWGIFVILLLLLGLMVLVINRNKSDMVALSFMPDRININDGESENISLVLDSYGKKIAFARVVITFDPEKVNLGSELMGNPGLSTQVERTTLEEANSTGRAVLVIAASPDDLQPSGKFELASFVLSSKTLGEAKDLLAFDVADMQIVDSGARELMLKAKPAAVNL